MAFSPIKCFLKNNVLFNRTNIHWDNACDPLQDSGISHIHVQLTGLQILNPTHRQQAVVSPLHLTHSVGRTLCFEVWMGLTEAIALLRTVQYRVCCGSLLESGRCKSASVRSLICHRPAESWVRVTLHYEHRHATSTQNTLPFLQTLFSTPLTCFQSYTERRTSSM